MTLTYPRLAAALGLTLLTSPLAAEVFINELHYDNTGGDTGEAVELAGPSCTDLSGWSVVLYNGNNSETYGELSLSGLLPDQGAGFGTLAFARSGIQNGSPDGLALVNAGGAVVQFLSYEGSFTAANGPAAGMTSTDIGVSEPFSTPVGHSLALTGTGSVAADFNWSGPAPASFGEINPGQQFAGFGGGDDCEEPEPNPSPVVINEFLADPASGDAGDANGDGTRDFAEDEFVEIVNVSGAALDMSGWTVADGSGERHVFPAGTVVADQCAVVVFGGGSPTGGFGGALVQTATGGQLGLSNNGDAVLISAAGTVVTAVDYGSEANSNQSLTLVPDVVGSGYVQHSAAFGANGDLFSPGTRADGTLFDGCVEPVLGPFEIFVIQGTGSSSPYDGSLVSTENNVVTAVSDSGFHMQTPSARSDANRDSSDGIFVFTGGAPDVAVGDLVNVTGRIAEFERGRVGPRGALTEFAGNPQVTVVGTGAALPEPVVFDATVPSPDPLAPSCAIEFECYEGMLISVPQGTVNAGNQRFGSDPIAEVHITAGPRALREPGIAFPGNEGLPVWDGNPEVFELDVDKLGLPSRLINAGSTFSAIGVLGFEFGGYELWPTHLEVTDAQLPRPVRAKAKHELTVGSLNLFRLFDDVDDEPVPAPNVNGRPSNDTVVDSDEYLGRLAKFADYIVNVMGGPDILAVQEVEKLGVLQDLAAAITLLNEDLGYEAYLESGNDVGGIDVGFLVRSGTKVRAVTQLGAHENFIEPDGDLALLHDRPPLLLDVRVRGDGDGEENDSSGHLRRLFVLAVHNRSLSGIDGSSRVRLKRLTQAQSVARMVQELQDAWPEAGIVVTGDFNAYEFSDGYVDVVGQIRGEVEPQDNLLSGEDLVTPDLRNEVLSLPAEERYSFIFRGTAQALDHALTNQVLATRVRGLEFARGNTDAPVITIDDATTPLRSSDHDGLVLYIDTKKQGKGKPEAKSKKPKKPKK